MKDRSLKILLVLLGSLAVFMLYSVVSTKAAGSATGVCLLGENNIYAKGDLSVEDRMALYHETINKEFNTAIKAMIKAGPGNADGLPPETEEACTDSNYSTFCLARRLLTNPNYGYIAYHRALTCSRYELFETAKESKEQASRSQIASVLAISARLEGIDREIESSKRALDQTLAAYNELRTAWPMHKKYVAIYGNLVKYRDKLAEIRSQAEDFPAGFIDVTTTQCI